LIRFSERGGAVASAAYLVEIEVNPMPCVAPEGERLRIPVDGSARLAAVSIEFVANERGAAQEGAAVGEAVEEVLGAAPGFAGCLVLIADEEKRLVTVITFWAGAERLTLSKSSAPWIRKAIGPYLEHCLRIGWFHTGRGGMEASRATSR
jgi:hypothetical protein